jgi:hypothetical protein
LDADFAIRTAFKPVKSTVPRMFFHMCCFDLGGAREIPISVVDIKNELRESFSLLQRRRKSQKLDIL